MARPREFDLEDVLSAATGLFWRNGFAGTSLAQLDHAVGINRASLYNAFGNKRRLFLACLDHYGGREISAAVDLLSGPGPGDAKVRKLFNGPVKAVQLGKGRRGCLLCNSAVEVAPHDPQVEAAVMQHLNHLRDAIAEALADDGTAKSPKISIRRADQLIASYMGLHVMAKAGAPVAQLKRISAGADALLNS
jgi:TetR/AcrR family transcriptional regulator, transcriptional repressor for nem operon